MLIEKAFLGLKKISSFEVKFRRTIKHNICSLFHSLDIPADFCSLLFYIKVTNKNKNKNK